MSVGCCCATRRIRETAGWLAPAAILALLPKCPLCIIALVAATTGFGLAVSVMAYLRVSLAVLSVALLTFMVLRTFHSRTEPKKTRYRFENCEPMK